MLNFTSDFQLLSTSGYFSNVRIHENRFYACDGYTGECWKIIASEFEYVSFWRPATTEEWKFQRRTPHIIHIFIDVNDRADDWLLTLKHKERQKKQHSYA